MPPTRTQPDFTKLSVPDRIKLIGNIWDSIVEQAASVKLTAAQAKDLRRRELEAQADPDAEKTSDEVDRIAAKHLARGRRK